MPDFGKNIDKAKQKAIDELNARAGEMSKVAYDILLEVIEETFDIEDGKIVTQKNFIQKLNKLTDLVIQFIQEEPRFNGPVSKFVKRMPAISEQISKFQKSVNGINVPAFETEKKIVIDEIIDKMLDNGLNQNFVQPLRDLIYQNATAGVSLKNAREQLKEYIQGGKDVSGKLGKYIEQTAQQAVDSYSGAINVKILERFDMDAIGMSGTIIDNTSPQCRFVLEKLGGIITRKNWPQVKAIAEKNGLIEGTTFDNLPLNLLHWNCRHSFYPIIQKQTA